MKTNKQGIAKAGKAASTLSAEQVYDVIMGQIEPDLVSDAIASLDEKYKDELPDDRQARMERYSLAFMVLDECMKDMSLDFEMDANDIIGGMQEIVFSDAQEEDAETIDEIEKSLENTDTTK